MNNCVKMYLFVMYNKCVGESTKNAIENNAYCYMFIIYIISIMLTIYI